MFTDRSKHNINTDHLPYLGQTSAVADFKYVQSKTGPRAVSVKLHCSS